MTEVVLGVAFTKSAQHLPVATQSSLADKIILLREDYRHPTLHTKKLHGQFDGLFSFRITREWRVIFRFLNARTIQLQQVAHRKAL